MIGDIIGIANTVLKHWTPEKIRARARLKLKKLQKDRDALLKKPSTPGNSKRMLDIMRSIRKLQDYLSSD